MPTADRIWSLKSKLKEYINENDDGTLKIRVCQECFGTFETANVCPYCGAEYQVTPVEIQNFKEIELKKVEEAKAARLQKYRETVENKVKDYKVASECKNWFELINWVRMKRLQTRICLCFKQTIKIKF